MRRAALNSSVNAGGTSFCRDRVAHAVLAVKKRRDRQSIALHQFGGARVKQRESTARDHHRHPAQQLAIQHLRLRHVRQFRGPADIGHGWQHVILHHRPQQRIGRQLFRRGPISSAAEYFRSRQFLFGRVLAVLPPQSGAPLAIQQEHQRRFRLHVHLRVITRRFQLLAALDQLGVQAFVLPDRLLQ